MAPNATNSQMHWKGAVEAALRRYARRNCTAQVDRGSFLAQELARMVHQTGSIGRTPHQTVSRVLQELRDEGFLYFSSVGKYVLNEIPLDVLTEDAPEDVLENAAFHAGLLLSDVDVSDSLGVSRIRRGVHALRRATLSNYRNTCALCDIQAPSMLVTSHIARWADNPQARGLLANTICLCRLHDPLFEQGFFSLDSDLRIVLRRHIESESISTWLTQCTRPLNPPPIQPSETYLQEHRRRVGL